MYRLTKVVQSPVGIQLKTITIIHYSVLPGQQLKITQSIFSPSVYDDNRGTYISGFKVNLLVCHRRLWGSQINTQGVHKIVHCRFSTHYSVSTTNYNM